MKKIKVLIGLIGVFIALQFTPLNMVSLYFNDKNYVIKINNFNNWKNEPITKIKNNKAELKSILEEIAEDEKNKKAFDFKKQIEKYNYTKKFSYTEIKEFEKDINIFNKLNNWVNQIRQNIMILIFIYLLYLAWLRWTPKH